MKRKVLFADNDEYTREVRKDGLERAGYQVYIADSPEKVVEILEHTWVHVVVLDIRLRDDTDDKDISGLTLAKQQEYRSIPKIILTRYPSYQYVREAMGPSLDGLPPAVCFLDKREGLPAMIKAVDDVFRRHVPLNWNLHIRYCEPTSALSLACLIRPQSTDSQKIHFTKELKGIFRKLFYEEQQITLLRILTTQSNQILLEIAAHTTLETEVNYLVSCGCKSQIWDEADCYEQFATVSEAGKPIKVRTVETVHFAATLYRFPKRQLETLSTFAQFYQHNSIQTIHTALDSLFDSALAPWYTSGRFQAEAEQLRTFYWHWLGVDEERLSLSMLTQITHELVRQSLAAGIAQLTFTDGSLDILFPSGEAITLPNPLLYICQKGTFLDTPTQCGITHGQVNPQTVLMDSAHQAWLTHFAKSGQGPLLRDFLPLEMAVRFDLSAIGELETRYQIETDLLAKLAEDGVKQSIVEWSASASKAISSIERIRHWATTITNQSKEAYLAGLLFCAISRLAQFQQDILYTRQELLSFMHSLLLISLIYEYESPAAFTQLPAEASTIWVNTANRTVWVEGQQVGLTVNEYKLLSYLLERKNQPCSHKNIAENIWGEEYAQERDTGRLNNMVLRLRKKIESDPKNPTYLKNMHGYGYQLELPV